MSLLSLITGTNPWLLALVVVVVLGGTFGAGYGTAVHQYANVAATAYADGQKAQHDRDVQMHTTALAVGQNVAKADKAHDDRLHVIVSSIHEPNAPSACNLPPAVAEAITNAGAY